MMSGKRILASEMLRRESSPAYRAIPTFVQELDKILGGGIKPGMMTEFVGDVGIGKTTFCMQLCLNVQIPVALLGLQAEAIYIDTENSFVGSRVKTMANEFVNHCNNIISTNKFPNKVEYLSVDKVMKRIHVVKCMSLRILQNVVLSLEEVLKRNRKVRLIVIDSIAFPFCSTKSGFNGRIQLLYSVAQVLQYLSATYDIPIVITNNLTTRFDKYGRSYFVPFLGEAWQHVPSQRVLMSWKCGVRTAEIIKSPCVPEAETGFKVAGIGIR